MTPGEVAYNAYRDSVGGRSMPSTAPIPAFEDLSSGERKAWEAAAEAVCLRYGAIY